jgi:hypothetical protein
MTYATPRYRGWAARPWAVAQRVRELEARSLATDNGPLTTDTGHSRKKHVPAAGARVTVQALLPVRHDRPAAGRQFANWKPQIPKEKS